MQREKPNEQMLFKPLCSAFLQLFPQPKQVLCLISVSSWESISKGLDTWRYEQIGVITACNHYKLNIKVLKMTLALSALPVVVDVAF